MGSRSRTYTFGDENVYVSSVKRIRFRHETYTSWAGAEFASSSTELSCFVLTE